MSIHTRSSGAPDVRGRFVLDLLKKMQCGIWNDVSARWFLPPCSRPPAAQVASLSTRLLAFPISLRLKRDFRSFTQDISLLLLFLIPSSLLYCFHVLSFNFFPFHCAAPPCLPSPPVFPAAGLLNYAFSLHAALQYSAKVETYFHCMCTLETIHLPPTISVHLPPTLSSSNDF